MSPKSSDSPVLHTNKNFADSLLFRLIVLVCLLAVPSISFAQDFTARSLGDYGNVTVMEVTGNYDANKPDGTVNSAPRETISKEFFKTHKDEYDFLVIFSNFDFRMPEDHVQGFYTNIKNDVRGIGQDLFDYTQRYGSSDKLQGTIDMGNLSAKVTDPLDPNFEETLEVLGHETMHRWAAHAKFRDTGGNISAALLGKDASHWSFLLDTAGSVMYGNRWQDNGNGTFTSITPQKEMKLYSPLDLYLMGMIDKSRVPPMLLIENPSVDPTRLPEAGVTVSGTPQYVTIDDIIAAEGPRVPGSADSQKSFKSAFIFITSPNTFRGDEIYSIENIRNGWVTRHSILTDGQSIVQVASTPKEGIPVNPGILPPSTTPRTLPPDINDGVRWLMNSQQLDGSWADLPETIERDTAEAVLVLKNFTEAQASFASGFQWLARTESGNMDYLSRKIEAFVASGQDVSALVAELLSRRNSDGGWGSNGQYKSNAMDTAIALKALSVGGYADQSILTKTIEYLKTNQKPDGGWTGNGESTIQATAAVLTAFNAYSKSYPLNDYITKGMTYLLSKQNPDGGFGNSPSTVYDTATAAIVLRELNASTDITNKGLEYLLSQQTEDGSWNKSPYQTALAVNAIYKATVDPDLSIKNVDITFIPVTVTQLPSNIVINANIWNTGRTAVPQAKVVLYEGSISETTQIGEQVVAFPGQQATTVTFAVAISDGNEHRYYIVVDPDNLIKESSETNNTALNIIRPEATFDFEILPADIAVSQNPVDMFTDVTITSKITNKGTTNAYNVQVKYFIDEPGNPFEIATSTVNVPANATITDTITWRANKAGANLPLTVQADPFDSFAELSEANNKASVPITVNALNLTDPNLTISYKDIVFTPNPANEQGNVNISALVKNEGFSTANSIIVNFYRGVPGPNGLLLGTQTIPSLAPSESSRVAVDWTNIPESGEKIIYIQVDPANQIQEITEDDNDAFTTLNVLSLPDLTLSANSISFDPAFPKDGDRMTVSAVIQNTGEQAAQNVVVNLIEGSTLVSSQTITTIAAQSQATASLTYDTAGKQGIHELTVVVDPNNAIVEQNDENNRAFKFLGIQNADLWLSEQYISPNGDGVKDSTQFFFRLDVPQTVKVTVSDKNDEIVRTFSGPELQNISDGSVVWDGLDENGMVVADGQYQIKVTGVSNTVLNGLPVVVDTNRSPLTDALGTKYISEKNLSCNLTNFWQGWWDWMPDDSGVVFSVDYDPYDPYYRNSDYYEGIYIMSPDGLDIQRLVPWEWKWNVQGSNSRYTNYERYPSPDGSKIAFTVSHNVLPEVELWIVDTDGRKLTLVDQNIYRQYSGDIWGVSVKWSPDSKYILYFKTHYDDPLSPVKDLWLIDVETMEKRRIDSNVTGWWLLEWSPDSKNMAYVVLSGSVYELRVADPLGNIKTLSTYSDEIDDMHWLNSQKLILISGAQSNGNLWIVDASGNGNNILLPYYVEEDLYIAPDRQSFVFLSNSYYSGEKGHLYAVDGEGNVTALHEYNNWYPDRQEITNIAWSLDSKSLYFIDITYDYSSGYPRMLYVYVVNMATKEKKSFDPSMATEPGSISELKLEALPADVLLIANRYTGDYYIFNKKTGIFTRIVDDSRFYLLLNKKPNLVSPLGHYIAYHKWDDSLECTGSNDHLRIIGSLLNLTADLRVKKSNSALVLKGIAADLNFDGYKLEYANVKSPGVWNLIAPPSNLPVVNDVFTSWVPPAEGTFYVRLTVWDKAGNTATNTRRVSWGRASSITNLYKSLEIFSPNGDGVKDTVELHYRVLEPVHLEFFIYDADNNLVTTIQKDHTELGEYFISWDGGDGSHNIVPDGKYKIKVFDFEFFVEIDTVPPDVHIALGSIGLSETEFCPPHDTEIVSFDRDMGANLILVDLRGRAVDKNQESWVIEYGEGDNPQDWRPFKSGGVLFVPDQNGNPLADQDAEIQTFYQGNVNRLGTSGSGENTQLKCVLMAKYEVEWLMGKKFRITAEDSAGNRSTFTSNFLEERILLLSWDLAGSVLNDGEGNFLIEVPYDFARSGLHALRGQETVRPQVGSVNVQYKYKYFNTDLQKYEWTDWIDGPVVHDAVKETEPWKITLLWDDSSVWDNLRHEEHPGLFVRMKGVDISGRVYYSNLLTFGRGPQDGGDGTKKEPFTVAITLKADYKEAECGQLSNRVELTSDLQIQGEGKASLKTLSYYIQKAGSFQLVRQIDLSRENWSSAVIDTENMAEGTYPVRAVLAYFDFNNNILVETSAENTLVVDHSLPVAQITYPRDALRLCPLKVSDSNGDWYGIPVEVTATDNTTVKSYELLYDIGGDTTSWTPATTRLDGKVISLSGRGPIQGQIGTWDVTNLKGEAFSLKLKAADAAGNVSCVTTSFSIDTLTEIARLAVDKTLFSPNGDAILDDVTINYQINEYATVGAKAFKLIKTTDGSEILDPTPVSTIASGVQHLSGSGNIIWDGKADSGAAVPDGRYGIVVSAADSCGNTAQKWTAVEVDNTPPAVNISYPKPGDPLGNIVEVKGTADDLHFRKYTLEAGRGDIPDTWTVIASNSAPVKDTVLDTWNTFGLDGKWTLRLSAEDTVGNKNETRVTVDLGARKNLIKRLDVAPTLFSPNNDGKLENTVVTYELTDACDVKIEFMDSDGLVVRTHTASGLTAGTYMYTWDGTGSASSPVADGSYRVALTAALSSNASVTQTETVTVLVDTTPPLVDIKLPANNSFMKTDVTVLGNVSDQNLLEYSVVNTGASGSVLLDRANQSRSDYTFGTLTDLTDGSYALTVTVKDRGENTTEKSMAFTIDRTPPAVKLDAPKDGEYYGGDKNSITVTGSIVEKNLDAFSLRYGPGDNPTQWTELLSGSTVPASPQLLAWGVGQSAGIPDGLYTLSLVARDKAGSEAEVKVKVTIDNTPPEALITSPAEGEYIKAVTEIKGTASDLNLDAYTLEFSQGQCSSAYKWAAIKTVTASVQNGVLATWNALPVDGEFCLKLTAVDKVGTKKESEVNVKVDAHPPDAPVLSGTVENKTSARLTWTGNVEPDIAGYNLYRNNQKVNATLITETAYLDQNLSETTYVYTLKAVDNAGWESQPSNEIALRIDITPPSALIRVPNDRARISGVINIKGTVLSADDFKQYRVYIGQGATPSSWTLIRTSPVPISYGELAQWDTFGLIDGAIYSIKLEAEDTSGNINTHQITVTVDNTPPSAPILDSATLSIANVTLVWHKDIIESDLAGYLVYRNDQIANAAGIVVGDLKPYLITGTTYLDKSLPDGTFVYSVVAVDQAGNTSDQSNSIQVNLDTHAPHATIIAPAAGSIFSNTVLVQADSPDIDIASIQFQYKKAQDSAWTNLGSPATAQPYVTYLDPSSMGLSSGDYNLRAVATDNGGRADSAPSYITVTYKDLTPPAAPNNVSASTNGNTVSLVWSANTGADLNGYNVYRTSGGVSTKINAEIVRQTTYQDNSLPDGDYSYQITAIDTSGNESASSVGVLARVYAPVVVQPSATVTTEQQLQLSGTNATPYSTVELFDDSGSGPVSLGTTNADAQGNFTFVATLQRGNNRITARARDTFGNTSRYSNTVLANYHIPPAAPTGLVASVLDRNVQLAWNPNSEPDVVGYNLYRNGQLVTVESAATGTANASSTAYPYDAFVSSNAIDSDQRSMWLSDASFDTFEPTWWEIDFPSNEQISHLDITWAGSDYAGKDYQVQFWNGSEWVTNIQVTGNDQEINRFDLNPAATTAKLRIYITAANYPGTVMYVGIRNINIIKREVIRQPSYTDLNLRSGSYTYTVTAVDGFGFESLPSNEAQASIEDGIPPAGPRVTINNVTSPTSQSSQVISGTMDAGATVSVICPTATVGPVSYPTATAWQTMLAGMTEGNNTFTVTAADQAGTVSNSASSTIAVDTTPPAGSIAINGSAAYTNNPAVLLTLGCADAVSGCAQMEFSNDNTTWTAPEAYKPTRAWLLASGDGPKTVYVKYGDSVGNVSGSYSSGVTLDSIPPTGSIAINGGAAYTDNSTVTLSLTCTDAVSGCGRMEFSNDNATWTEPETYTITRNWTLSPGDGLKTVYVRFQDAAGNWSEVISNTITLDVAPPATSLSSDPSSPDGDNGWFRTVPSITLTSNESGTTYYRWGLTSSARYSFSRQPQEWVSGGTPLNIHGDDTGNWYTLPFSFTFYGTSYTQVFLSSNGLIRFGTSDTTYSNSGSVLAGKAAIAPLWDDLRTDSGSGNDIYVYVSQPDTNSVCFRWQAVTYSTGINTNFEAILYRDGRIRFNYGNQGGGLSPTIGVSKGDSINYHIAYDNNISNTNNMDSVVYTPASDWKVYSTPFTAFTGEDILYYYSMDSLGHVEAIKSQVFKVDTVPPSGSIAINNGATDTSSPTVSLSLTCTDAVSGCARMEFSNDNATWTEPEPYATARSWTLSPGVGLKTVYTRFQDAAGNRSNVVSSSITLTAAPTTSLVTDPLSPDGENSWFRTVPSITLTSNEPGTTYYQWGSTSSAYSFSRQPQEWIDGGTPLNIHGDDTGAWYTLPFSFTFYGTSYTQVSLSSNGLIRFSILDVWYGNSGPGLAGRDAIAPLWDDLRTDSGSGNDIYVYVSQPDTNSVCFRWQAVTYSTGINTNFEAILYRDGRIRFNYGDQGGGLSPTIGISKGDGTNYHIAYDNNISNTNNMDSVVYTPAGWRVYASPFNASIGENTLYYYSVDSLGHVEAIKSQVFKVDTAPPSGSIAINNGTAYTNSTTVTLALTCTDTVSGCARMEFSNDNATWTEPEPYATARSWTLASGDGSKTVYVKYIDIAGNISAAYSANIILDTTPPVTTASPAGGVYDGPQSVTLAASEAATIYYTTDGTMPTANSSVYRGPITIGTTTTLQYFSVDIAGNVESVKISTFTILTDLVVTLDDISLYPSYPVAGEQTAINAVIWNKSQVEARDVDVLMYLWSYDGNLMLLKSEKISNMVPGSSTVISAAWDSKGRVGEHRLVVTLDPWDAVAETDETNNLAFVDFYVSDRPKVDMTTTLDDTRYNNNQDVRITVSVRNNGVPKDVVLETKIEDENGYPAATFDAMNIAVPYTAGQNYSFVWNTGTTYAGSYQVHAAIKDASGVLAENIVPFSIISETDISATIVTDKPSYGPLENVGINYTIVNNSNNFIVPALTARVKILDAAGNVLLTDEKSLTNLLPGAPVSLSSTWNTGVSQPGDYRARLEVLRDGEMAASNTMSFKINPIVMITGSVVVLPAVVPYDNTAQISYSATNSGNTDGSGLLMTVMVLDPGTQTVMSTHQETIDIAKSGSWTGQYAVSAAGYGLKTYTVSLQSSYQGVVTNIGSSSFTVKDLVPPVVTITSPVSSTTYNATIPISVTATDDASGVDRMEYQTDTSGWKLLPVADPSSGRYAAAWEPTIADNGPHTINFRATDKAGNTSLPVPVSFTIQMDSIPPVTTIAVGAPKYEAGRMYADNSSVVTLSATDNFSGVAKTEYRIDGVDGSPWTLYAPFTIGPEGDHRIEYRSEDYAGNREDANLLPVTIDNTPPLTHIVTGEPRFTAADGNLYVSSATAYTLSAADNLSGVARTEYRIDTGQPVTYAPFTLAGEGSHTIWYRSSDNLGHWEAENSLAVIVDSTVPETTISIGNPKYRSAEGATYVTQHTAFTLSAADALSGVALTEYRIDEGAWTAYAPFTIAAEGSHTILYRSKDNVSNQEADRPFIVTVDNTPPETTLTVGEPKYASPDETLYMTSATQFTLAATDNLSGVARTEYRIDGGDWTPYSGAFTISAEGVHTIEFYSADNLGHAETVRIVRVVADNTPPETTITVRDPRYVDAAGMTYATHNTVFTLSVTDSLSGVALTEYRIDEGAWTSYSPFAVAAEGRHTITYRSKDNLGNPEAENTFVVVIDNTPPVTTITADDPKYTSASGRLYATKDTTFTLAATDNLSGAAKAEYRIDGGDWAAYAAPFTIPGEGDHTIEYRSQDNVTNLENTNALNVTIDNTPPMTEITVGTPKYIAADGKLYVTSSSTFTLSATDNFSGVARTEYRVDGGVWTAYAPFTLSDADGSHTISYRSTDNVGNVETDKTLTVIVDNTPPQSSIYVGTPQYNADGNLYVSGSTLITMDAVDAGSGLKKTEYRIDGGSYATYAGPMTLAAYQDGTHTITYRSIDNLGNIEADKSLTVILDKMPPVTSISASDPLAEGTANAVSPKTVFTLSALDNLSGVKTVQYRIDSGEWQPYMEGFSLSGMNAGQHTIEYKAVDNVLNEETAKSITVRIVVLEVEKKISTDPVVLVGVWSDNSDETRKQADIQKIDSLLSSLHLTYTIAQTMDEFTAALRSGRYNTYILIDVKEPLVGEEIREAVHSGGGLIFLKTKPDADPFLDDVFGVKSTGRTTSDDLAVDLASSPISNEGILQTLGKNVVVSITAGTAETFGTVADKHDTYPVIVFNQYERGRAILYTFDLMSAPDQAQAQALMVSSLNHVRPLEHYTRALDSVPIRITLKNSTEPVDVKLTETIPNGTTADTILPQAEMKDNIITWMKSLGANEKATFKYYLNLPDLSGDYTTAAQVMYSNNGYYRLYGDYDLTLTVQNSSYELHQDVMTDLKNLTMPNATDAEKIANAINDLSGVVSNVSSRKEAEENIRFIVKAADEVRKLSIDTTELRLKLGDLLRIWEKKWYLLEN